MGEKINSTQTAGSEDLIAPPDTVEQDQFDVRSANVIIRRIVEVRAYAQTVDVWAEEEKQRCAEIEEILLRNHGAQLERFARMAITQHNALLEDNPRKFIKLPAGTIGFRDQRARLRVMDEETAIKWCQGHLPIAIRTTERVSRVAINEHFEATGQIPDGVTLESESNLFYVK